MHWTPAMMQGENGKRDHKFLTFLQRLNLVKEHESGENNDDLFGNFEVSVGSIRRVYTCRCLLETLGFDCV